MAKILVVGLNPAWQKVLCFRDFRPGEVNRAVSLDALASGKGINTAKVLRRLGHEVWLLQILGGDNGRRCQEACEAMASFPRSNRRLPPGPPCAILKGSAVLLPPGFEKSACKHLQGRARG